MTTFRLPLGATAALVCGLLLASAGAPAQADSKMKMVGMGSKMPKTAMKTVYTCPMHPEVLSLNAGKCPKCKMALVKKSVSNVYTCSMHPAVVSLKPGKCPVCKMALTKMK